MARYLRDEIISLIWDCQECDHAGQGCDNNWCQDIVEEQVKNLVYEVRNNPEKFEELKNAE